MKSPDIPPIATGNYLPPGIEMQIKKEEERQRQMENLEQIANESKKQVEIMKEQLELQKEEIKSSKKQSKISLIISIIAIIATIASAALTSLFSLLGI